MLPEAHIVRRRVKIWLALLACMATGAHAASPLAALYDSARKEGVVEIWGTNVEDLNWIPRYFNAEFPDLTVRIYTDLNVASRLITESRAGHHTADVVWNSEALIAPLTARQMLQIPDWSSLNVTPADVGGSGYLALTNSVTYVVAFNKKFANSEDLPKAWVDLLQPKYRGRVTSSPFLMARLSAGLAVYEGEDVMTAFTRRLRDEGDVLWSNDLSEQLLASGERAFVAATAIHFVDRWIAKGQPFGYCIPEPVLITQFGGAILNQAPHPNAARLLVAWMASPAGKRAREEATYAIDLRPGSTNPRVRALGLDSKEVHVDSLSAIQKRNEIIPRMDRILAGGE